MHHARLGRGGGGAALSGPISAVLALAALGSYWLEDGSWLALELADQVVELLALVA